MLLLWLSGSLSCERTIFINQVIVSLLYSTANIYQCRSHVGILNNLNISFIVFFLSLRVFKNIIMPRFKKNSYLAPWLINLIFHLAISILFVHLINNNLWFQCISHNSYHQPFTLPPILIHDLHFIALKERLIVTFVSQEMINTQSSKVNDQDKIKYPMLIQHLSQSIFNTFMTAKIFSFMGFPPIVYYNF